VPRSVGTSTQGGPVTYRVVLLRRNGRYVRSYPAASKYAAKRLQDWLEEKYDDGYYAEIRKAN
jgi:hypothetical protein